MQQGYKMIREAVNTCPLPLLSLEGKLKKVANSYLPYDTGIEIECSLKGHNSYLATKLFMDKVPTLKAIKIDSSEQRFRISSGINGLVSLYGLCDTLKELSLLNMQSGIHYHIDFTEFTDSQFNNIANMFKEGKDSWILNSLKSWDYKGQYNAWIVSTGKTAVRFHKPYRTVEFRIGEMSFDYELLVKRIVHCQNISKKIKADYLASSNKLSNCINNSSLRTASLMSL